MIARQLFQTCKDPANVPAAFVPLLDAWRSFCEARGFRHEIFDDAAMDAFVREEDAAGYGLYRDLETVVERTDYWRYLVVLRRGGLYADLDCAPRPALSRLPLPRARPLVQIEDAEWFKYTPGFCQLPEIGQFFFGFPAGSDVLAAVMAEMKRRLRERPYRRLGRFQEILFTSGPGVFGSVVLRHRAQVDFFAEDSLVEHRSAGTWTGGLDRGRSRLLIRTRWLRVQPVP